MSFSRWREGNKKPAGYTGGQKSGQPVLALDGLWELGVEFDGLSVVALGLFEIGAAVQHTIEFVDEE